MLMESRAYSFNLIMYVFFIYVMISSCIKTSMPSN